MDLGLAGKTAVVTGAAGGIGSAIAGALGAEGCRLLLADKDADKVRALAGRLCDRYGDDAFAVAWDGDLTSPQSARRLVERILAQWGRLDILVNSAGLLHTEPGYAISPGRWEQIVQVNLSATLYCCQAAVPALAESGNGRIISISSVSAERGGGAIGSTAYAATKAGVVALTKGMARELGPKRITVNAIAPGLAETPMTADALAGHSETDLLRKFPLGRIATPQDIAPVAAFLASSCAAYITGTVITVDGGYSTA